MTILSCASLTYDNYFIFYCALYYYLKCLLSVGRIDRHCLLNSSATLDELESLIGVAYDSISVETLQDVMLNFIVRLRHLILSNGEHFEKNIL